MSTAALPSSMGASEASGLELRIETPENVLLTYQLAGPALRAAAVVIDYIVQYVAVLALAIILMCAGGVLAAPAIGTFLIAQFLLAWGYFTISEWLFSGKTIGKHAMRLRVVDHRGSPLNLWPAMVRNLIRFVDSLPAVSLSLSFLQGLPLAVALPLGGVGVVSMLLTSRFQRLGDLAAGTVVISEHQATLPREPIIIEKIDPLPRDVLGHVRPSPRTLSVIDEFLGRRHVLSHGRGHAVCGELARSVARRLDYRGDRQLVERYPMAFLARIYVTYARRDDEEDDDSELWEPSGQPARPRVAPSAGQRRPPGGASERRRGRLNL